MAFSTAGTNTRSCARILTLISKWASASATAAPPMSFFMRAMPELGLMSKPPLSKHTPLPINVTRGYASPPGGAQRNSIRRGASLLARPTA